MESNNINQEFFEGAIPLGEPHFDEEATVLSARPVVPLQEIKAAEQSQKRLIVGLAMACSLMMGALAATLVYKQRGEGQSTAITTAAPGAAGMTADDPVSSPTTAEFGVGAVSGTLTEAGATTAEKKSVPPASSNTTSTTVELQQKKNLPEQEEELELTRAERIDSRRLRRRLERQALRESGARQRKTSDDLLRIRDIFEGPPGPKRSGKFSKYQ
jgi:hypothetical protein